MGKVPEHLKYLSHTGAYAPKRLKLIGQINTDWNLCEQMMQIAIWGLAGFDYEMGECITADLSNVSLLTLCKNILNRFHSEDANTPFFLQVCNLFDECRQGRNAASHSLVLADESGFEVFTSSMKSGRGNLGLLPGPKETIELDVITNAIGYLLECFNECMCLLHDEPLPSRDKRLLPAYTELLRELRLARQTHDFPPPPSEV
ncbi:hypothetical protein [Mesorhizobium sangaii]|uniref:Uncharacterized protein n=1 Tax=Mesorhizobium sangaii TaxID=505389 RepID=A0A841PKW6_9HYPH|nr:hypothetical protein [Mesorhizobium sangaii]MBB6414253.1 hypothetical protein [Mesorhizobium sangaii]